MPDNILTTQSAVPTTPFNVLQLETSLRNGENIYKLFSNQDLEEEIPRIFTNVTHVRTQDWPYTFPHLDPIKPSDTSASPPKAYQPIILSDGIYYLNTMESVASAMEGSVIAARNVAQLMNLEPF